MYVFIHQLISFSGKCLFHSFASWGLFIVLLIDQNGFSHVKSNGDFGQYFQQIIFFSFTFSYSKTFLISLKHFSFLVIPSLVPCVVYRDIYVQIYKKQEGTFKYWGPGSGKAVLQKGLGWLHSMLWGSLSWMNTRNRIRQNWVIGSTYWSESSQPNRLGSRTRIR